MDRTRLQWLIGFALLWVVVWAVAFRFDLNFLQTEELSASDENKKRVENLLQQKTSDSEHGLDIAEPHVALQVKIEPESMVRWQEEMERIRSSLGQMFAEICAVWLGSQPFSPEGGYTMIHDTYLFFVPAHVRIEKLADITPKRACQNLLFLTDAPTLHLHIEDILKGKLNSEAVRNLLWLTNANRSISEMQHQAAIRLGVEHFDFVFYHRHTQLDLAGPQKKKLLWLPLGYSVGFTPPAYPQLSPASTRKYLCSTWNAGADVLREYPLPKSCHIPSKRIRPVWARLLMLESVFVICPTVGNSGDTHCIWEALDAGAIPLIIAESQIEFGALPNDHPLIILADHTALWKFLAMEEKSSEDKRNALQQKLLHWWLNYRLSLQIQVADIVVSFINNTSNFTVDYQLEKTPADERWKAVNSKWIRSVVQLRRDVAQPKEPLHVTWTQDPSYAWEYGVTFDRYLGLVDARVRMCKLSNYSEDTQECCGHVLLDLLIASWFGGVPANYREFAQRACMKSVGVLVHGNELEPNITSLLLDKQGRFMMDYAMHNYFGSPEYRPKTMWLPLGYTYWVPPASPPHIVPASRRRWLCSFKGSFHRPERTFMRQDFATENDLNCLIEESAKGDDRLRYREDLLSTAIALCPRGQGPDTFRLWESLDAGAIPVVVKHPVYNLLPKDNPIMWVDDMKDFKKVVTRLRDLPPGELDRLQRRVVSWWYDYTKLLQLRIAKTINSVMTNR